MVRAILRKRRLFSIVDGIEKAPVKPKPTTEAERSPVESDVDPDKTAAYAKDLENFELKQMKACTILYATISTQLITYFDDIDDSAQIWKILQDKYKPITQVIRAQALKELQGLKMAEGGDMEMHLHSFWLAKRRVKEHGIKLNDDVYKTALLLFLPDSYKVVVSIVELQLDMTTEAASNRLQEEYRKKKTEESMMALLTNNNLSKASKRRKFSKKADKEQPNLKCNYCQKLEDLENECWTKNPQLKPKKRNQTSKTTGNEAVKIAFHITAFKMTRTTMQATKDTLRIGSSIREHQSILAHSDSYSIDMVDRVEPLEDRSTRLDRTRSKTDFWARTQT